MSIEEITNICGQFPKNFKKEIITGSNHIFQVDPNYAPINLQNFIGNSVTVNSFAECLHYVEGGFKPSIITIFELSFILLGITSLIFFVYKLYQIKFLSKLFKSIKILFVKAKKFNFDEVCPGFNNLREMYARTNPAGRAALAARVIDELRKW